MDTKNIRQRLRSYLDDGLMEMALGVALISLSSWFMLDELMYMAWMLPWMFMVVLLPGIKKKVAGPRGGVVDFPKPQGTRGFLALLVLGLAVLATFGLVVSTAAFRDSVWFKPIEAAIQWLADHFAAGLGFVFMLVLAKLGLRGMTPRLIWLAGLCLVAGILADLLIPSGRLGALATGWAVGVPLAVIGYINYRRFINTHPPIENGPLHA